MRFIGVEGTSEPLPKKNPGSASARMPATKGTLYSVKIVLELGFCRYLCGGNIMH